MEMMNVQTAPTDADVIGTRICSRCGHELPLSHFRMKKAGGAERARECNPCHSKQESERKRSRKSADRMKTARKLFTDLRHAETAEQAERIVCGLASSFGGAGKLYRWWHALVQKHRDSKPEMILPFVKAMMQFEILQDQRRASFQHFTSTPDGQAAFRDEVLRLVRANPKLVLLAADAIHKDL